MKRLILFVLWIGIVHGLFSQTMFQRTSGTLSNDRNYHLMCMPGGSLFATGYTESVAGNSSDAILVKYNRFGVVEWAKTYGSTGDETNWDVIATQNHEIVGVGYSSDLSTYEGGIITRSDSLGNVIWSRGVVSMAGNVNFYRVMETSDGHLVATGLTSVNSQDDILLCKFTASGTLLWSRIIKTPQDEEMMGLIETSQGDYLMAGLTNDITGQGSSEFAVVKTDTAGNVIWKKRYGGIGSDRLNALVEHHMEYYFLGWSSATGIGGNDVVVLKTDSLGNLLWINAYGTPQTDRGFNMLYDSLQNSLIIAGYTDYSDSVTNNRNTFLMSVGLQGTLQWSKSYGSTGTDGHWPTGLAMNDDAGYYVLGSTNTFGPGNYSLYLVKTDIHGNTGCYQKDPQFVMQPESGFNAINFGTDSTIQLTNVSITINGVPMILSSSVECCHLYNDLGPDQGLCPDGVADLGSGNIPGYQYAWTYQGNAVGNQAIYQVSWVNAGTYLLTVSAFGSGCASVSDTVFVDSFPAPPKPVITIMGNDLISSVADGYQWYYLQMPVPGATQQVFTIPQDGYYYVEVYNGHGCASISDSVFAHYIGMEEWEIRKSIRLFPNPVKEELRIVTEDMMTGVVLHVFDINGRRMLKEEFNVLESGDIIQVKTANFPAGVYYLHLWSSGTGSFWKKFIVSGY